MMISNNADSDVNLLMQMYQNQNPILTKEFCLQQGNDQLASLFHSKFQEAEIAFERSGMLVDRENVSIEYSECIVTVEKAIISARCIQSVFEERAVPNSMLDSIRDMEQKLNKMRPLQPSGETTLQMKTIDLMRLITTIPTNETYTNNQGVVYVQPKVSHKSIRLFFEPFCSRGGYKSVQTGLRQNRFYHLEYDYDFFLVNFMKEQSQAVYELERLHRSSTDKDEVKARYHTTSLQTLVSQTLAKISNATDKFPDLTNEKVLIEKQKQLLKEIEDNIYSWNENEQWGFGRIVILSTEEQIAKGIAPKDAVMADCILLFHKKIENK